MQKIIINKKYYGKIEIPQTKNSFRIFNTVKNQIAQNKLLNVNTIYSKNFQKKLTEHYQVGGSADEIEELEFYILLGETLHFKTEDAQVLKQKIEQVTDTAHVNLNISKRLTLLNKKRVKTSQKYLFWDIENFSNIPPMFFHLIEPYEIEDKDIYIAANPDSLYLYKAQWDAEFYDFSKSFDSFNFTKCDHGKDVADTVLLDNFKNLKVKNSDIYLMTYDRELKERFLKDLGQNNLYIMGKK